MASSVHASRTRFFADRRCGFGSAPGQRVSNLSLHLLLILYLLRGDFFDSKLRNSKRFVAFNP